MTEDMLSHLESKLRQYAEEARAKQPKHGVSGFRM